MKFRCTITETVAQVACVVCLIPMAIVYMLSGLNFDTMSNNVVALLVTIVLVVVGIPVHEFLHGFGWFITAKKSFSEYKVSYHFPIKASICFAGEMGLNEFRFGLILPCFVLGVFPIVLSVILMNEFMFMFGALHFVSAGSDLTVFFKTLGHSGKCFDPVNETGVIIVE